MVMQVPVRGLRAFCIAAKNLSFKKTANQLFITPSAVSHQVKQLDHELGFNLFHRQIRSMELTDRGYQFYNEISPIMDQLEGTVERFKSVQAQLSVSIAVPEFFASEILVPKLSDCSAAHPNVSLVLETLKVNQQLKLGSDLSVILTSSRPASSWFRELLNISYVPACNRENWLKVKKHDSLDLTHCTLITHKARPFAWQQWADKYNVDILQNNIIQLDSMFAVARAAQKGLGIALIPIPISDSWFEQQLLYKLSENNLYTQDKYYLVLNEKHAGQSGNEDLKHFANWLSEQFHC